MRASDLLEADVIDTAGRSFGKVRDVHVVQDGPLRANGQAALRVHGVVAGRFAIGTRLGYVSREGVTEMRETRGPFPIRAFVRWLHRHARYVAWEDIVDITNRTITITIETAGPAER